MLRNCSGKGKDARIFLNGEIYKRCPKAIFLENRSTQVLVETYFACKNMNSFPADGGILDQTAFTIALFDYISGIIEETRARQNKEENSSNNNNR